MRKTYPLRRFYNITALFFTVVGFSLNAQPNSAKKSVIPIASESGLRNLDSLGKKYENTNIDSSFHFYQQSLQLARKINNPVAIATAMYRLSFNYIYLLKDDSKGLVQLKKAVVIAKKGNDYTNLARCYSLLGIIALHQNPKTAKEFFETAIAYSEKTDDWRLQVDCLEIYANYYTINDVKQLEKIFLKILQITKNKDFDSWFSNSLDYGDLLESQEKTKEATALYKNLNLVKHKLKQSKGYFVYMNDLGKLETKLKNYQKAEQTLITLLEYEKQQTKIDTFHLSFVYNSLINLYEKREMFQKAYQASLELIKVKLWLTQKRLTIDSQTKMAELRTTFGLEKKEAEIKLLEAQKKQQLIFLITTLIGLFTLAISILYIQKSKTKIEKQKAELNELNATKDKLFAILSHDLRSPVANLENNIMLSNWGALSQSEFSEMVHDLGLEIKDVKAMLENLLNWSISQMGGMNPNFEKIDISKIGNEQMSLFESIARNKNIQLINQIPEKLRILGDKNHWAIILRNLLQNAIKFTTSGDIITFNYGTINQTEFIEVKDSGIGITEDFAKKFQQNEKLTSQLGTNFEQGTGIGLLLVKELVALNNYKIEVYGQEGIGSTFRILLK